jgi:hypothetical protein
MGVPLPKAQPPVDESIRKAFAANKRERQQSEWQTRLTE